MKTLNRQDISDILYGCAILGTGGGGELDEGFDYIDEAIKAGKTFKLINLNQVPEGKNLCTPYMLGAISPMTAEQEKAYEKLNRSAETAILTAFNRLKEYSGEEYYGTICCELGGSNTAISFYLAAMMDGYIIDADPAGRAVPEITHSTYYLNQLPADPIVAANEFGECFVIENVADDLRAETLVRALSMVSRNDIAVIDHALDVSNFKGAVIEGTISKALELGRVLREAQNNGINVPAEIAKAGDGFVAFRGQVKSFEFSVVDGFTIGSVLLEGDKEFKNKQYKIVVKNENMYAIYNDSIHSTIPDLICCLESKTGNPITNPNFSNGMEVTVIILPALKEFLTPKGLQAFGPKYCNLDINYQPATKL